MEKFKVTFYPDKKTVTVDKDRTILSAAMSAGVYINSVCSGDGVCGRCKVIVKKGSCISQPNATITQKDRENNIYLACITTIHSDLEVEIPPESRVSLESISPKLKGIYSESEDIEARDAFAKDEVFVHSPLATKFYLELPKPDLEDRSSDLERLYRTIKQIPNLPSGVIQTNLSNVRKLGELLRDCDWKVTVTLGKRNEAIEVVLVEPNNTSDKNFGLAFDIGTTTISCQLIDLNNRKILGTKASYNRQASFGSDVISRIVHAQKEDGLTELHKAVIETMNHMAKELIEENKIDLNYVTCAVCAGNTTMIQLLLNIDPSFIRREPYVPTASFLPAMRVTEAGININPRSLLYCVPSVASYVGGDIVAGVLSSGLYKSDDICILIDIGTNGEIVLGNKEFMVSCAASAGPAFEGSGVKCGMRATHGAIQKVSIKDKDLKLSYQTLSNEKPRGICGSGYIDLIGQLLRTGVIDKSGKINSIKSDRIRKSSDGAEFVVAFKSDTAISEDIVITEADIENIKRAKAAIYSATATLVKRMGLDYSQIKKIFIAGGFGTFLDIDSSIFIGLLPDLERKKFVFIGNSALSGARQILLSNQAMKKADEIAKKITYFELSVEPAYMDEYMAALFFPHTDFNKFPSVKI